MKKIIRKTITIKTRTISVVRRGAVENGNAHDSEIAVCPVCNSTISLPALPANEISALREISVKPTAQLSAATDENIED